MYFENDFMWECFEKSGRITDYLEYKGLLSGSIPEGEGECEGADKNA